MKSISLNQVSIITDIKTVLLQFYALAIFTCNNINLVVVVIYTYKDAHIFYSGSHKTLTIQELFSEKGRGKGVLSPKVFVEEARNVNHTYNDNNNKICKCDVFKKKSFKMDLFFLLFFKASNRKCQKSTKKTH